MTIFNTRQEILSPDSPTVQFKLATIWQARGHLVRAMAGYEEAIRLRPDYVPAHLELGQLVSRHGTADEAAAVYRRAIELNPREVRFQQKLAELLARQGAHAEISGSSAAERPPALYPARDGGDSDQRHVVLYTDCSGIGGAEQCTHTLALALVDAGYRVTYVQGRSTHYLVGERERCGIRHVWLEDDSLYDPARPARSLMDESEPRRILEATRPDLLIFGDGAPLSSLAAKGAARELGIPYLVVVHCATVTWAERYAPYLGQLSAAYQHAEDIIAVSHANLRLLGERFGLPNDRGRVIYNGRPARFFAPPDPAVRRRLRRELGVSSDDVLVCTVASMEMRKGYHHLLKAIKGLRESADWARLHFAWVGTGTLEPQLRAVVDQLGARNHVRFLGERADVADILEAADIFVLTSHYEGMPLSIMEAMARGLPVAATGVSGIPEELGDTGKLLPDPLADPRAVVGDLVATIGAWAKDAQVRQAIGQAGRHRADALFTQDRMVRGYLAIVESITRQGGYVSGEHVETPSC